MNKILLSTSLVVITAILLMSCKKEGTPPHAIFEIVPSSGTIETVFTFDASASYDDKDEAADLLVHWDWTNDGIWDTGFSPVKFVSHQFSEARTYTVVLGIKNSRGLLSSKTQELIVTENPDRGTFEDIRDARQYNWVMVGNQIWMAENLAYLPSIATSSNGSYTEERYYVYDYEDTGVSVARKHNNFTTYGVLYNWPAAMGACPLGWHLPTDAEWKILEKYLGMTESDANNEGWRFTGDVGYKMKSTSGWEENGNGDNSIRFNAIPGGRRYYEGGFRDLGIYAYFWSYTKSGETNAWSRSLYHNKGVFRISGSTGNGFSVRCVED